MVSMNEASMGTPLAQSLAAGLQDISYSEEVSFSNYIRMVLPLDGFIFYVRADLVDSAVLAGLTCDSSVSYTTINVPGSLHTSTSALQEKDQNLDLSRVIFTTRAEVKPFHDMTMNHVWIGDFNGIKFAINSRKGYYRQAELHHYVGATILPTIMTQVIDDISQLNIQDIVLSNSVPFFLALTSGANLYAWMKPPSINFYPAYLSPDNMVPPYATVYVDPNSTQSLQAAASFDTDGSRWQHVKERAKLTFFGLRNQEISDVLDYITRWCSIYPQMGIMNMPVIKDEHQLQPELGAIPIKKTVELDINYYQRAARDISMQYILHCIPTLKESW